MVQVIEEKERELVDCIAQNYSKLKGKFLGPANTLYEQPTLLLPEAEWTEGSLIAVGLYSGVERELAGLQLDLKLTSGPKKSALELLRRKIEMQNENVVLARGKFQTARKVCLA